VLRRDYRAVDVHDVRAEVAQRLLDALDLERELALPDLESVKLPLKLSVRWEPLATARAVALRAAAAFEGRPPSFPASRGSISRQN